MSLTLRNIEPIRTEPRFMMDVFGSGDVVPYDHPIWPAPAWDLRQWCNDHHVTVTECARRLGLTRAQTCRLMNGSSEPLEGWDEVRRRLGEK